MIIFRNCYEVGLEIFAVFYGGEDVVFAGYPYIESGQEEDADD